MRSRRKGMLAVLAAGFGLLCAAPPSPAALGTLTASRTVHLNGTGFSPDAAVAVAQCGSGAVAAAGRSASEALDYCDQTRVALVPSSTAGAFATTTRVSPTIQTPSGAIDCRPAHACLLGALNLDVLQGHPLQVALQTLSFSASAHDPAAVKLSPIKVPGPPRGVRSLSARRGYQAVVIAGPATGLGSGRTGIAPRLTTGALPRRVLHGEGLLALTMSAPATSWSDPADTSVTAEVRVDHGPWQQIVLFEGATPFTYEAFTGPLASGRHTVAVRVRPDLSHVQRHGPVVEIERTALGVVAPTSQLGVELAHAPVLYGRTVSPTRDTPLMTYATDDPVAGHPAVRRLTYVVTWSREDAGTGFVPWLEWGTWGRMTDIETAISMDVDAHGRTSQVVYLGCVSCGVHFPPNRTALDETDTRFAGHWYAGHPILRVATGNNDFSDVGTTPLRFQLGLVAPPAAGATREGAMDRNPWTYAIEGQELTRTRADYSTDPASPAAGDPRQYLTIQLDTSAQHLDAVGVDIRFAGSSQIYSNDFGTTYPLYDGGSGRTVVKVPLPMVGRPITLLRLRALAPTGTPGRPKLTVHRVTVLQFTGERIVSRRTPPVTVTTVAPPPSGATSPSLTAS